MLSVGVEGATVTQVAQRHEVTRQQLYAWRHELKKKRLLSPLPETVFLPVELSAPAELAVASLAVDPTPQRPVLIELQLANGRCLRFNPMLDTTTLTRLIRVVEAA